MGIMDKTWDGITQVIKMDSKVESLSATVKDQQKRIEDLKDEAIIKI
jgi:hypothetical protein